MPDSNRSEKLSCIGVVTAIVLGLYLSSQYSYLLFHSLIEISTIAIGFTLFILTWNTRRFLANNILTILGIGYAFIALIDLLHTLAYKGMNVFPGFSANLPTQLWIAARYLQAVTLCAALFFVGRRVDNRAIFGGYAIAVSVLVAMVYSGNFPDCYIEGKGLTTFKIGSEYVISALLLASSYLLYRKRRYFNDKVFFLLLSSMACSIVSEISFTTYLSVYGFANMIGHYFKLAAFYLIYRALLVTGLREPFDLIFRELRQAQERIRKAHDTLEEQVRVRTAELRASEEKYRALIECANDAVFVHEIKEDGMPGSFIEVNEPACTLLGYSREELVGLSPVELDDPRYLDRIAAAMERLLKDGHALFETAQIAKDGRSIPVEVSARVIELRGKRLLFFLVRNITERKRTEEALFAREQMFRTLAEHSPDLIIRYDCDCRRIYANPVYEKFVCLPLTEALGKTPFESWGLPIQAAPYMENLRRVLESGIPNDFEFFWRTPEGGLVCHHVRLAPEHDQDGKVVSVLAVIRDISELKKKDESLRLKELAISSASSGIYFADLSGEVFYVNRSFLALHGFDREVEMLGQHLNDFFERERIAEITAAVYSQGNWKGEIAGKGKDGNTYVVDATTQMIRDQRGKPLCFMGIVNDITERKRAANINQGRLRLLQFAATHSVDELLQAALDEVELLTGSVIGFYHFLEPDQKTLVLQGWSTRTKVEFCTAEGKGMRYDVSRAGVWADCIRQRVPVVHNDYASLPNRMGIPRGHPPVIRELVVPVMRGDKIIAIFGVGNKPENFNEEDLETVSIFADFVWEIAERKRVEERLALVDFALNNVREAAFLIDEHGRFHYANYEFCRSLGYHLDELLGLTVADVDLEWPLLRWTDLKALGSITFEGRHRNKDGHIFPVEINANYFKYRGRSYNLALARDITERKRTERELLDSNEGLRKLAEHLETIREEERTRISREIHDDLGQLLTVMQFDLSWLINRLRKNEPLRLEKIHSMRSLVDDAVKTVQRISSGLRPRLLDDLGLSEAIEWQAKEFGKRTGIKTEFSISLAGFNPNRDCSTVVFRICKEAFTNILRHAKATKVSVSLARKEDKIELEVADNGKGISQEEVCSPDAYGLMGIRERALSCGGEVLITGSKGNGTIIRVSIPC